MRSAGRWTWSKWTLSSTLRRDGCWFEWKCRSSRSGRRPSNNGRSAQSPRNTLRNIFILTGYRLCSMRRQTLWRRNLHHGFMAVYIICSLLSENVDSSLFSLACWIFIKKNKRRRNGINYVHRYIIPTYGY